MWKYIVTYLLTAQTHIPMPSPRTPDGMGVYLVYVFRTEIKTDTISVEFESLLRARQFVDSARKADTIKLWPALRPITFTSDFKLDSAFVD